MFAMAWLAWVCAAACAAPPVSATQWAVVVAALSEASSAEARAHPTGHASAGDSGPEMRGDVIHRDTLRALGEVRIESERLAGVFRAALAARCGTLPSVRLQLFPDVGGAILDVTATPTRLLGRIGGGELRELDPRAGVDEPDVLVMIAATLAEACARVDDARVRDVRHDDDGWRVSLQPAWPLVDLRVDAIVSSDGKLLRREYRWGRVAWEDRRVDTEGPDRRSPAATDRQATSPSNADGSAADSGGGSGLEVEARGFHLSVRLDRVVIGDELPDALFAGAVGP